MFAQRIQSRWAFKSASNFTVATAMKSPVESTTVRLSEVTRPDVRTFSPSTSSSFASGYRSSSLLVRVLDERRICWSPGRRDILWTRDFLERRGARAVEGSGLESRLAARRNSSAFSVTCATYLLGVYPATVIHHESA